MTFPRLVEYTWLAAHAATGWLCRLLLTMPGSMTWRARVTLNLPHPKMAGLNKMYQITCPHILITP